MLRIGFLGMGLMGKRHAENILKIEGLRIVSFCSSPREEAFAFNEAHALNAAIFDDGFEMIQKVEMDVLYICLPPFAHTGQFEAAVKKGIHVFIEKPIAQNIDRATLMHNAVQENNVLTQVGYHMRYGGAVKKLKNLIDTGVAGSPLLFTGHYECNSLHTPWWKDVTKSGGQVFEQVIHLYDLALYFMGPAAKVSGYLANLNHKDVDGYTVEDTSISNIVFSNGTLGCITGSNCAVKNEWNANFRIVCQNMVVDFEDYNNAEFIYTDGEKKRVEKYACNDDVMLEEDKCFISSVQNREKPSCTLEDGYNSLLLVDTVVKSSEKNGCAIMLTEKKNV